MNASKGTTPRALCQGDTIAIISPSGRLNDIFPNRVARGKEFLEQLGYQVKIVFNVPTPTDHWQRILHRCEEIHSVFADSSIKAIFCTIGGLSANELLPHLDYDLIKANPKIFCGYSDITLFHSAFFTQASLRTFYGPALIPTLGEYPRPFQFAIDHFLHVLRDSVDKPIGPIPRSPAWTQEFLDWGDSSIETSRPRHTNPALPWKWLRPGKTTGRIFGGCLPSILQLTGTKYLPDFRDRILLLETPEFEAAGTPVPLEYARSWMADLVLAGIIGSVSGIVLGRPYSYDDKMRQEFEQMVVEQCYGTEFPILANVDVGHTDPILTLPLNALATLDSDADEFTIIEAAVTS